MNQSKIAVSGSEEFNVVFNSVAKTNPELIIDVKERNITTNEFLNNVDPLYDTAIEHACKTVDWVPLWIQGTYAGLLQCTPYGKIVVMESGRHLRVLASEKLSKFISDVPGVTNELLLSINLTKWIDDTAKATQCLFTQTFTERKSMTFDGNLFELIFNHTKIPAADEADFNFDPDEDTLVEDPFKPDSKSNIIKFEKDGWRAVYILTGVGLISIKVKDNRIAINLPAAIVAALVGEKNGHLRLYDIATVKAFELISRLFPNLDSAGKPVEFEVDYSTVFLVPSYPNGVKLSPW